MNTQTVKPSAEVLAAVIEKIRWSNPPHDVVLPDGCTRAEAERLEQEAQEAHPWQKIIVVRFIRPGQAHYDYDKKQWIGDLRFNSETKEYDYFFPDDPPPESRQDYGNYLRKNHGNITVTSQPGNT